MLWARAAVAQGRNAFHSKAQHNEKGKRVGRCGHGTTAGVKGGMAVWSNKTRRKIGREAVGAGCRCQGRTVLKQQEGKKKWD
eukprot:scaffold123839_cov10-Tisochrysis_lutea.AAC.1